MLLCVIQDGTIASIPALGYFVHRYPPGVEALSLQFRVPLDLCFQEAPILCEPGRTIRPGLADHVAGDLGVEAHGVRARVAGVGLGEVDYYARSNVLRGRKPLKDLAGTVDPFFSGDGERVAAQDGGVVDVDLGGVDLVAEALKVAEVVEEGNFGYGVMDVGSV